MNLIAGLIRLAVAIGFAALVSGLFVVPFWHALLIWVALDLYVHAANEKRHLQPERKAS